MAFVILDYFFHRNSFQIGIKTSVFDEKLKAHIKKIPKVKWSKTYKIFYIPHSKENKHFLFKHFTEAKYYIDYEKLKGIKTPTSQKQKKASKFISVSKNDLNSVQIKVLKKYVSYLRGKRYSESTVRSYYGFLLKFVAFSKKEVNIITYRDFEIFLEKIITKQAYSISSHRQCVSALKHFATLFEIEGTENIELLRPKKSRLLPTVLSQEEVIKILQVTKNLKHRFILALIYSSGLRIGELINMEVKHIDINRKQIFVLSGKGRKDRTVILAESILPLLYNYLASYHPQHYLIEGNEAGKYSSSSIRAFLKKSCKEAKILKRVTPHTLRHSYATHMLEDGVDLRYIQTLLGHSKPETTMIYTHVTKKGLLRIKSPLDMAVLRLKEKGYHNKKVLISGNI